jgi:hypothetical protein
MARIMLQIDGDRCGRVRQNGSWWSVNNEPSAPQHSRCNGRWAIPLNLLWGNADDCGDDLDSSAPDCAIPACRGTAHLG